MYQIRILDAAARDLARLGPAVARRIVHRIRWFAENLEDIIRVKSRFVLLFALVALLAAAVHPALATPTAPVTIVNHTTKQCAQVILGDDCHWCDLDQGWEILGPSGQASCPLGYADLGHQGMSGQCRGYKSQFCCTSPQHHGDCDDLVVNEALKECAFVNEISGCTLPEGWTSAGDATRWQGRCPLDWWSGWVPDVACVTSGVVATATTMTATTSSPPLITAGATPTPPGRFHSQDLTRPALAVGLVVALGLFCVAGLLIMKRLRR